MNHPQVPEPGADPAFDLQALCEALRPHLDAPDGPASMQMIKGGQSNPTYRLNWGSRPLVLRKKPAGVLLPSAHAIEREYRVVSALQGSGVPVAPTICLCEDVALLGTPFYVMGFVQGRILWDPALPGFSPRERGLLYDDINRVVAALHSLDPAALNLGDYGKPGDYLARQIARWSRQYQASATDPIPEMDRLIDWLSAQAMPQAPTRIVHGDLRLDNMMVHPTEPRVVALLDWELSTLGDPLADMGYHMLPWYVRADEFRGMAGEDFSALGIPLASAYLQSYVQRTHATDIDPAHWDLYLVYNLFRLAAILQGIAKRVDEGTAASKDAAATGRKARPIAELAWRRARDRLGAT